jgi:hypothetical protein
VNYLINEFNGYTQCSQQHCERSQRLLVGEDRVKPMTGDWQGKNAWI